MEDGRLGKLIAVIPARGGSKRIPRKNIVPFMGKPMIAWTIEAALDSGMFDRIYVSTDDREIADVAVQWGASIPFFRERFADDFSPVSSATLEFAEKLPDVKANDVIVQLMANCPLRSSEEIKRALRFFESNSDLCSVISGMPYGMFNPWWAHEMDQHGRISPLFEEAMSGMRSQDLPKLLCPTGAVWISTLRKLKDEGTFYSEGYRLYDIGWQAGVDIDDYPDLEFAKAVCLLAKSNGSY